MVIVSSSQDDRHGQDLILPHSVFFLFLTFIFFRYDSRFFIFKFSLVKTKNDVLFIAVYMNVYASDCTFSH